MEAGEPRGRFGVANSFDPFGVFFPRAVGCVEPKYMRAGANQGTNHFGRFAGRAQSHHDLRVGQRVSNPANMGGRLDCTGRLTL